MGCPGMPSAITVRAASMERREDAEYDFCEPLLERCLDPREPASVVGQTAAAATTAAAAAAAAVVAGNGEGKGDGDEATIIVAGDNSTKSVSVIVAMMFLLPGRHAGAGGDVAQILREAEVGYAGEMEGQLVTRVTELLGRHRRVVQLLKERYFEALAVAGEEGGQRN